MRRQDRESMRGKSNEDKKGPRDDVAASESGRSKQEEMKGGPTSSDSEKPSAPRTSGRLPLPD
jgi:hypothetical protein